MLEIHGLCKSFGSRRALDGLSLRIAEGQIYGLLGHNGAGKSTTLGIILGMVRPDAGDVTIGGVSVGAHRARALAPVGAIFESPAFYEFLSGWDNLRLLMSYSRGFDPAAARDIVARVGLADRIRSKVRTYSHGMRQRLALAQALLPEPRILLLDEPTDGLDPEGIKWFRDFILDLRRERGMTVLFNSHLLAEVEQMCDRVAILREGRLVFDGAIGGLHDDVLRYELDAEPWEEAVEIVRACGGEAPAPGRLALPHGADPAPLVAALVGAGVRVRALVPVRRSLEDLYMNFRREGAAAPD
ncbi:MAG: ABC transporter ATP-binding protein [Akkermansiaceae bacterium]|nr:ABC transporter ATP-binding protein [Akkermansiaceae bacterium]